VNLLTWEEAEDLHRRFPKSQSWGQAGFQGGGNVRTYRRAKAKKRTEGSVKMEAANSDGNPTIEETEQKKPKTVG
jgi:hypothetical protein